MQFDVKATILSFSAHLGDQQQDPEQRALMRQWLDPLGTPTDEGTALARALSDQSLTRTALRHLG